MKRPFGWDLNEDMVTLNAMMVAVALARLGRRIDPETVLAAAELSSPWQSALFDMLFARRSEWEQELVDWVAGADDMVAALADLGSTLPSAD